jgi:subtilisin family serine protease
MVPVALFSACGFWARSSDSCSTGPFRCATVLDAVGSSEDSVPGEYLVKVGSSSDVERFIASRGSSSGIFVVRRSLATVSGGAWHKVVVPNGTNPAVFLRLAMKTQGVVAVEPNRVFESHLGPGFPNPPVTPTPARTPNPNIGGPDYLPIPQVLEPKLDPKQEEQWGLVKSRFSAAWEIVKGAPSVVVASIDSGIDYNHEDIIANLWRNPGESGLDATGMERATNGVDDDGNGYVDDLVGYDFRDLDPRPFDENGHGTHTAGIMGAVCNNGVGVCGAARQIQVMALRFKGGRAFSGTAETALASIVYAVNNGATILSNSWGGRLYSEAIFEALEDASRRGVLVVASAGNETVSLDDTRVYPASYALPNLIAVAATGNDDELASFSSFGSHTVHLAAPGVGILSLIPQGRYDSFNGTSMSVPFVSAAAALLKSGWPKLDATQLKSLLLESADRLPALEGKVITSGRLNAVGAVQLARERFGEPAVPNQ